VLKEIFSFALITLALSATSSNCGHNKKKRAL